MLPQISSLQIQQFRLHCEPTCSGSSCSCLPPLLPTLHTNCGKILGEKESLLRARWPKYVPELAKEEEIEIPVQINGKLRSRIIAPADASADTIVEKALADEKIKAAIAGKKIVKKIVVPSKLVNIVVR